MIHASSNTDSPRGDKFLRGHVNVVITKMPVKEILSLRVDLHKYFHSDFQLKNMFNYFGMCY